MGTSPDRVEVPGLSGCQGLFRVFLEKFLLTVGVKGTAEFPLYPPLLSTIGLGEGRTIFSMRLTILVP